MSNLTIFKNDIPVEYQAQGVSELTKSLASARSTSNTSRRITAQNGVFKRLVNGEEVGKLKSSQLNVIIVGALPKVSRQFYAGAYDPKGEARLPDCWSNLGNIPDSGASNPQGNSCATCPQNIAGSGPSGGTSRACKYQRRIAVILEGDTNGDVYQMTIASPSLFGDGKGNTHPFESYINYLIANNESIDRIITEISFNEDASINTLQFTPVRHLDTAEQEVADNAGRTPAAKNAVNFTVAAQDGVKKLPKAVDTEEFAPTPKAKVADDVIEEPVKRPSSKPAAPTTAPKKDIADVVSAWSDEE